MWPQYQTRHHNTERSSYSYKHGVVKRLAFVHRISLQHLNDFHSPLPLKNLYLPLLSSLLPARGIRHLLVHRGPRPTVATYIKPRHQHLHSVNKPDAAAKQSCCDLDCRFAASRKQQIITKDLQGIYTHQIIILLQNVSKTFRRNLLPRPQPSCR